MCEPRLVQTLIVGGSLFQQPVKLFRRQIVVEKVYRIDALIELDDFVVAMRTG